MEHSSMVSESSEEHPQPCDAQSTGDEDIGQTKLVEEAHEKSAELVVGPEMLSEILSKKRLELLGSSEVKEFLMKQQSTLFSQLSCSEHDLNTKKDSSDSDASCDSHKSDCKSFKF